MYCTRIAQEPENVYAGSRAVEFTLPQQAVELSNAVAKEVDPEREVLFLRYYSKFDAGFDVTGSCHNGGGMSAHYFINGQATPGVPSNGYNKFLAEFECWRGDAQTASPGYLNVYIYHPEQRSNYGDHFFPTGLVMPNTSLPYDFGQDFVSRPDMVPELGRWYCYEFMIKANTVGQRDGRIACWVDGALIADFPNLRLRNADSLKIDRFNLSLHAGSNTVRETRKWYDNVVAATSYIGPMNTGTGVSPAQPNPMPAHSVAPWLGVRGTGLWGAVPVFLYDVNGRLVYANTHPAGSGKMEAITLPQNKVYVIVPNTGRNASAR
jgi:hypothetical protein